MTKKIGYSKTYPILSIGVWEKIWEEQEVPIEADSRQVWYEIKKKVENFHFESNKSDEKKAEIKVERPKDQTEGIIFDINNCNDAAILEKTYHLLAKSYQAIKEAYDSQLQKLTT